MKDETSEIYAKETKERWGYTDAYKQSAERTKHMTKSDFERIGKENEVLLNEIAARMDNTPESPEVQKLIARHHEGLRTFYEPSTELYRGLAEMYVSDPRFAGYYEKYAKGLASFMRSAMLRYADDLEKK